MSKNNIQKAKSASKERFSTQYSLGISSSKNYEITQDAQILAQHIIKYMQTKNKNYQFTDFYDPALIKAMRLLIKNQKAFKNFLASISFSVEDFFEIGVYVIPHVFTSHLIKYIRVIYFGADPEILKTKKKKNNKKEKQEEKEE